MLDRFSPAAKAYAGAVIAFLAVLVAQPDFGARSILTAIVGAATSGGVVYAVPNRARPQLLDGITTTDQDP